MPLILGIGRANAHARKAVLHRSGDVDICFSTRRGLRLLCIISAISSIARLPRVLGGPEQPRALVVTLVSSHRHLRVGLLRGRRKAPSPPALPTRGPRRRLDSQERPGRVSHGPWQPEEEEPERNECG